MRVRDSHIPDCSRTHPSPLLRPWVAMTDHYLKFANSAVGARLTALLGLPRPLRLERFRPGEAPITGAVLMGSGGSPELLPAIATAFKAMQVSTLAHGECSPWLAVAAAEALTGADASTDLIDAILDGAAELCEQVLAPLNLSGDAEGCHFANGEVSTPTGFKQAYRQFVDGGWQGLSFPVAYGGQGLPTSISVFKTEMMGTANWSFAMYPGLSVGCINTLLRYGTDAQKQQYLPSLVAGEWAGTMCLTEPHCGTDLAQIKTRAQAQPDGSYRLTGSKIFISSGEHDLTANIIHIVLARLPGAPSGTRGISLFLVPKFLLAADGTLAARNPVHCGAIEHKMGIRASATATLNFDAAIGCLIGEPNKGLEAMFTFMNTARTAPPCRASVTPRPRFKARCAMPKSGARCGH